MSFARSYKKHEPPLTPEEEVNWKVTEVMDTLRMFFVDRKVDHLISAEYTLSNLVDGLVNRHDPDNPPF